MIFEAIILGLLQGILEWLPISSQGNLILMMVAFLNIEKTQALNLSIFLHAGTMFSVLIYFRRDFYLLLKELPTYRFDYSNKDNRLLSFIFFTSIITAIIGYPIFKFSEIATIYGEFFISLIGVGLIISGIIQKVVRSKGNRVIGDVNFFDTLFLGFMQGFSAFPGISRSGITISSLIFRNFENKSSLKLSFLMSVPAILVAEIGLYLTDVFSSFNLLIIIVSCGASFFSGLISIHFLLKLAQRIKFYMFCIIIGIITLIPIFSYF
jgi:undecaprenyl-diphosphatase